MPPGLLLLSQQLLSDPATRLNSIVPLLKELNARQSKDTAVAAVRGLKVFFLDAQEKGDFDILKGQDTESAPAVYREWLRRQYAAFHARLLALIEEGAPQEVQVAAVAALLEGVRGREGSGRCDNSLLGAAVAALVTSRAAAPDAISYLISTFLPCADVRFYTLRSLAKAADKDTGAAAGGAPAAEDSDDAREERRASGLHASTSAPKLSGPDLARSVFDVLSNIPASAEGEEGAQPASWCGADVVAAIGSAESSQKRRKRRRLAAEEDDGNSKAEAGSARAAKWASPVLQRRAWSNAWLALLRMPLPPDILRKVLVRAHADVMPHLTNPHLLTDFLTHALDAGGLSGMLALHGIFTLVTRHGLEYPHFYRRLYSLLTLAAMQAKQRARFFELADVFLASGLVPAYTIAAFAKRFARLALSASPAGALVAAAFVHNLLRRHPACNVLLHRPSPRAAQQPPQNGAAAAPAMASGDALEDEPIANGDELAAQQEVGPAAGEDPYLAEEVDPAETCATESSLWEIATLRNHYAPEVAAFAAALLDKDLSDRRKTAEVDIAPLRAGSYASMASTELGRRLKRVPTAFYGRKLERLFEPDGCAADFAGWSLEASPHC